MSKSVLCVAAISLAVFTWSWSLAQEKEKAESKPQTVELAADLTAQAPAGWKAQKTDRPFRTHEFILPSSQKGVADGFLFISHFGKDGGGPLDDNLRRWYDMVEQPDGSSTEKTAKKEELKLADGKVVWLDMAGIYLDKPTPMSQQVTKRPDYRVFAAMIGAGKEGPYWVRAYGPDSAMKAHRDGFKRFLMSIAKK